jgi:hypothetical protein
LGTTTATFGFGAGKAATVSFGGTTTVCANIFTLVPNTVNSCITISNLNVRPQKKILIGVQLCFNIYIYAKPAIALSKVLNKLFLYLIQLHTILPYGC